MKNQPTKEAVREWLRQRQLHREPPPPIKQIQREVGWNLIDVRDAKAKEEHLLAA
ncbi:hypothetical protein [Noviherbaspirillum denitrificans]|uniref:hypothetical protein n=1 Tax=Noviherbaspirillum denitrificans TaxID=1968433 RepID=UPI001482F4FB|nr:hypothetical protein [Noviherbaspirillum denitrificans]